MVNKRILLVVDAQYDFMMPNGKLYVPEAEQLIVPMIELLATAKDKYHCVFFTQDWHYEWDYEGSEEAKEFPRHCIAHSYGADLVFSLRQIQIPYLIQQKSVFDVWESGFDKEFVYWKNFTSEKPIVDVIGVASDYCVKYAVDGLLARGYEVNVIEELTKVIHE